VVLSSLHPYYSLLLVAIPNAIILNATTPNADFQKILYMMLHAACSETFEVIANDFIYGCNYSDNNASMLNDHFSLSSSKNRNVLYLVVVQL